MAKNDRQALFSALLEQHSDSAYRYAYYLSGNAADAWDLVQTAFLKVLENFDKYNAEKPFAPWIKSILHNLYIDSLRRYERKNTFTLDAPAASAAEGNETAPDLAQTLAGNEKTPLEQLSQKEQQEQIRAALQKLEEHHRSAIILSDIEGLSYEEIAQVMAVPVGTVRSRIHRARATLKIILKPTLAN